MSRDLEQLLHDTAVVPTRPLDVASISSAVHRRRLRMRVRTMAAATTAALAVLLIAIGAGSVRPSPTADVPNPSEQSATGVPTATAPSSIDVSPPRTELQWTRIDAFSPGSIAVTGNRLVGVGSEGDPKTGHWRAAVWLSDDGRSWRQVPSNRIEPGKDAEHASVVMASVAALPTGRLVAVGSMMWDPYSTPAVWLSDDRGESWRRANGPLTRDGKPYVTGVMVVVDDGRDFAEMRAMALTADGMLVAVGSEDEFVPAYRDEPGQSRIERPVVWLSRDGSSWQRVQAVDDLRIEDGTNFRPPPDRRPTSQGALYAVAAGANGVVAVGGESSGLLALASQDLITWRRLDVGAASAGVLDAVSAKPTGFLAVGGSDAGAALAVEWDDLGNLTGRDTVGGEDQAKVFLYSAVADNDTLIIAGEDNGRAALWTKQDGGWKREPGGEDLWPKGSISRVTATSQGILAVGSQPERTPDAHVLSWLGSRTGAGH